MTQLIIDGVTLTRSRRLLPVLALEAGWVRRAVKLHLVSIPAPRESDTVRLIRMWPAVMHMGVPEFPRPLQAAETVAPKAWGEIKENATGKPLTDRMENPTVAIWLWTANRGKGL